MAKSVVVALVAACAGTPALAQEVYQLNCRGEFFGAPARLVGMRQFGNNYARFRGLIEIKGVQANMTYEGYFGRSYDGVVLAPAGRIAIGVLDNLPGDRMIIYGGKPSLGPPDQVGEFVCRWQRAG